MVAAGVEAADAVADTADGGAAAARMADAASARAGQRRSSRSKLTTDSRHTGHDLR